ncbi:hypothetical protein HD597_009105 [Nonomuraea thailandensis]|uniref:LppX_LprAFG lipoprotein n=1 Tax=Nonomuraea thailandensis TaxID=1188745 RepID=A0A9X2GQD0_9ACTN|nr:hypothetical protein [Nonomuraea thailandensis]MCP2362085.1 hypothetical protein [Nonomuraea thailandensis]
MKRILTGVALVTTAALVTATPALAAAPKDPVVAVKKQLVAGKGVKFTERTTVDDGSMREVFLRRSGTLQFGKSGIAASDITGKLNISASDLQGLDESGENAELASMLKAMAQPERTIRIGTTSYLSGNIWALQMPEGKTWFKAPKGPTGGFLGTFGQPLNLAEPATLKTLLKGAKTTGSGYTGKTLLGDLWKTSPWLRATWLDKPSAKAQKTAISWRITVNKAGLPTRLVTTFPMAALGAGGKGTVSVDTSYTGWGSAVSIKAPPAEEVTSKFKDGEDDISETLDLPLGSIAG